MRFFFGEVERFYGTKERFFLWARIQKSKNARDRYFKSKISNIQSISDIWEGALANKIYVAFIDFILSFFCLIFRMWVTVKCGLRLNI